MKDLSFGINHDGKILLYIDGKVILPFESLEAFQKFAENMLKMIPEITDNL